MEIQGNVMKVGQLQTGTGQNGEWQRQDYVIEYFEHETDMWTQKIIVSLMGDNIKHYGLQVGDKVKVRFGLNFREYQGRFYQDVRLAQDGITKISSLGGGTTAKPAQTNAPQGTTAAPAATPKAEDNGDGLPF
jgi:hypothetical protein